VIQALTSAPDEVMAAEDIFKALMASDTPVSVATVYRVLKELEQHGMVRRHLRRSLNGAKSVYQLAANAEPASGAQLRCTCCGRSVVLDAQALAKAIEPIAGKAGFPLGAGPIQIEATCAQCAEAPARN
jgi:Fur family ferric uptake transcriptional regulator